MDREIVKKINKITGMHCKLERIRAGYGIKEFAKYLGCSSQNISSFELGKASIVGWKLVVIMKTFNIDSKALYEEIEQELSNKKQRIEDNSDLPLINLIKEEKK